MMPFSVLKHFSDRKGVHFPLLSDKDSALIRSLGLLNEEVPKNSGFYGIPHPVTYILDEKGKVVTRLFENDYRRRYSVGNIIGRKVNSDSVPARRVKIIRSSSDQVVHGGQRIKLRLELELPHQSHVYAPGVQGYIPINWTLQDNPAFESIPLTYPTSRQLHLKAIDETVPVYEGQLVLEREIVLGQKNPAGDLQITGSLRYQVCDDKQCYVPETVPIAWTLRYEVADSTRVPEELRRRLN